jgi:hypothetical protein
LDEDEELLKEEGDSLWFKEARAGDHLMVPFQCELCYFRNITLRDPNNNKMTDWESLDAIRRANLDAFLNRESATVTSNL